MADPQEPLPPTPSIPMLSDLEPEEKGRGVASARSAPSRSAKVAIVAHPTPAVAHAAADEDDFLWQSVPGFAAKGTASLKGAAQEDGDEAAVPVVTEGQEAKEEGEEEVEEPLTALDLLLTRPREPKVDLPVVFRTMREGAKNLRAGKGLGALSGNPLGEYEYLLDKCGLPADFFADPACHVTEDADIKIGSAAVKEKTVEHASLFSTAVLFFKAKGWKSGTGGIDTVYYDGTMTKGEAKKKGRGFFLQNNHAMLSAAVEQRPDLFKAQLRRLGWDV